MLNMLIVGKSRWLTLVLLLAVMISFSSGCKTWNKIFKKKQKEPTASVYPSDGTLPPPPDADASKKTGAVSQLPLEGTTPPTPTDLGTPLAQPMRMEADQRISELKTIYFDFDSYALSEDAKSLLEGNYEWLKAHPGIHVLIEGHCDERGTVEYNLNLGQKRADAVREYLILKGLDPSTLHTISYGEERPESDGHDESAWTQNRRVQFLVY
jgi:peptidoglycan-associated lipoprotein